MFCDICGFTEISKQVQPQQVMAFLNDLFSRFDNLVDKHKVYKVRSNDWGFEPWNFARGGAFHSLGDTRSVCEVRKGCAQGVPQLCRL